MLNARVSQTINMELSRQIQQNNNDQRQTEEKIVGLKSTVARDGRLVSTCDKISEVMLLMGVGGFVTTTISCVVDLYNKDLNFNAGKAALWITSCGFFVVNICTIYCSGRTDINKWDKNQILRKQEKKLEELKTRGQQLNEQQEMELKQQELTEKLIQLVQRDMELEQQELTKKLTQLEMELEQQELTEKLKQLEQNEIVPTVATKITAANRKRADRKARNKSMRQSNRQAKKSYDNLYNNIFKVLDKV